MSTIHILGTSNGGRPTNTEHHLRELSRTHTELTRWDIVRADSNAKALEALLRSNPEDNNISLAPFYNVHGKGVQDTMRMIAENYTYLRLLHISRLSVDYILAYRKGGDLSRMRKVSTHEQAILQTRRYWDTHGIPAHLEKVGANNTAAGLDYLINNSNATDVIAISTPWQLGESDGGELTRVDNFGPKNNHTYFGIFGLKNSDIGNITKEGNEENPEGIEFGVIELEDSQGSLAHALENIAYNGKDIHSIMSFPQNNGKVIFVVAYSTINGEKTMNPTTGKATISESYDKDNKEKPYTYRLSIPNLRGSLGITLRTISHLIDIRSIESIGTSRDDADFTISITPKGSDTSEILASIQAILEVTEYSVGGKLSATRGDYRFNTLRN